LDKPQESAEETVEKRRGWFATFMHGVGKVLALFWRLVLENLYIVTLAVVYICSLQNVNIINAIFRTIAISSHPTVAFAY